MAIPAFFKIASEVSKAKNVAEGDVTSLATKGIKKFNPDKRIDTKNTEPMKDSTQKFNPDKRIENAETEQDSINPDSVKTLDAQSEIKKEIEDGLDQYKKELIENSDYPDTINLDDINVDSIEKLPKEEVAKRRDEFKNKKNDLIKEWEKQNGKEWPRYKEDVVVNDVTIAKAGDLYDAHHIKPLSWGGENTASNITPMEWGPHHQKVHAVDSGYNKVSKLLKQYGG